MESPLPPFPEMDCEHKAISAYRGLGVMTLLDICQGESEKIIKIHYGELLSHVRERTAFIALDTDRRPLGYTTWDKQSDDPRKVKLKYGATPFCDYLFLKKALKEYLSNSAVVDVHDRMQGKRRVDEMPNVDYYASIGYALELLTQSPYHNRHKLEKYFRIEILPALGCNQMRFYIAPNFIPTAMVTWAWLSKNVERDVHVTGRALKKNEWNCGGHLFFNDWITPYGNTREVVHDMTHNIFPNEIATSLRRNHDASVRGIKRWTGINLRNNK